jgi:hypothetical protein
MKHGMTFLVLALSCAGPAVRAGEGRQVFCSPDGTDVPGAGTEAKPFRSIQYAFTLIGKSGDATVILLDGQHQRPGSDWQFEKPVVVRAKNLHKATLDRLYLHGAKNLVFDGLTVDRKSAPETVNVVHLDGGTSYCVLRNCIMTHGTGGHDNTDALKINDSSHHILIEGNEIFDGTDEEIDILQDVHDLVLRRNIVHQLNIRKEEALVSNKLRANRVMFAGNLFANLNPGASNGALRFGGSEKAGEECRALAAIGNLFVNTTGRGAMTFAGARDCLVADNIFVNHDDRRTGPVAIYSNYPKGDLGNDGLWVLHNVFYGVSGSRGRAIYDFPRADQASYPKRYTFSHNLYFSPGGGVPALGAHNPHTEAGAIIANPLFAGDLQQLKGRPTKEWFAILALKPESPFQKNKIDLLKLTLPQELKGFLEDYLTGKGDPWYKEIRE